MTSRYFQLNDYLLLEYVYASLNVNEDEYNLSNGMNMLTNQYDSSNYLTFPDIYEEFGNVRDYSAVALNKANYYGSLNKDLVLTLNDSDPNLTDTNAMPLSFSPNYEIKLDTVRIHFVSGYTFSDNDGFIIEFAGKDNSLKLQKLCSIAYLKDESHIRLSLNPLPFLLGNRMFSSYIEFKIPSLDHMISKQDFDSLDTNLLSYKLTNGRKLISSSNINVKFQTIYQRTTFNSFDYFNTIDEKSFTIPRYDQFSDVYLTIQESTEGDYIELFPSHNSMTFEDFMFLKNNNSDGDWIVIHQFEIFEQLEELFERTSTYSSIQENNFSDIIRHRPILLYSNVAVTWVVNYTLRILNRSNGEQIIKTAKATFLDAKKYGKQLERLNMGTVPVITKIYNRLDNKVFQVRGFNNVDLRTIYVTNFMERNNISVSISKEVNISNITKQSTNPNDNIKMQNEALLSLNPFDNYYKFIVYTVTDDSLNTINLNNYGKLYLCMKGSDAIVRIPALQNANIDFSKGECLFKISASEYQKIISLDSKNFYLTILNSDNSETSLYTGKILNEDDNTDEKQLEMIANMSNQIKALSEANNALRLQKIESDNIQAQLDKTNNELKEINANLSLANKELTSRLEKLEGANRDAVASSQTNTVKINNKDIVTEKEKEDRKIEIVVDANKPVTQRPKKVELSDAQKEFVNEIEQKKEDVLVRIRNVGSNLKNNPISLL